MSLAIQRTAKSMTIKLVLLGLTPRDAGNFVTQIIFWESCSGTEWTIGRLKKIYNFAVHYCFNLESGGDLLPYFRKRGGMPTGIFGSIIRRYDRAVLLKCLRCYTFFKNDKSPTENQLDKFFLSMEKDKNYSVNEVYVLAKRAWLRLMDYPGSHKGDMVEEINFRTDCFTSEGINSTVTLSDHGRIRNLRHDTIKRGPHISDWMLSNTRRAPVFIKPGLRSTSLATRVESEASVLEHLSFFSLDYDRWSKFLDNDKINNLCGDSPQYSDVMRKVKLNGSRNQSATALPNLAGIPRDLVGKISFIQEGGFKLRAVANPFRALQALSFTPSVKIWNLLILFEEETQAIHTYDQEAGLRKIQIQCQAGKEFPCPDNEMYSVDLSDATNVFPWEFQKSILEEFLSCEEVRLLDEIARGSWLCPDGTYRKFTCGQPLGAYFSFAAFSISHLALAMLALKSAYPLAHPGHRINIVGDDIVLRGRKLYRAYMKLLRKCDISISKEKSIHSQDTAEFLSKIVTPTDVVTVPKWSEVTPQNCMAMYTLDPSNLGWIEPAHRKSVLWWAALPEPLGLGRNPQGIPVEVRLAHPEVLQWWDGYFDGVGVNSYTANPSASAPTQSSMDLMFEMLTNIRHDGDAAQSSDDIGGSSRIKSRLARSLDRVLALLAKSKVFPKVWVSLLRQGLLTSQDLLDQVGEREESPERSMILNILNDSYTNRGPTTSYEQIRKIRRLYRSTIRLNQELLRSELKEVTTE